MKIDTVKHHIEILRYVKTQQAKLKAMEEASRAAVEEAMGGNEVGEIDGEVVVTFKHVKSRRLNQKALKSDHPNLVELYTETSESRRFEVQT